VRRSRHLVLYWQEGRLVIHNYATGRRVSGDPLVCRLLDACPEWTTRERIGDAVGGGSPAVVYALVDRLVERGLLEADDRRGRASREHPMSALDAWNPAAGFFHSATKNVKFWSPMEAARQARAQADRSPMPSPVKRYRGAAIVDLPRVKKDGEFAEVLLGRRTWRRFSKQPLTIAELATILGLSVGVQQWVRTGPRDLALKTSPSGGARHPIECYVIAQRVDGLRPGLYHYAADRHALERLRGPVSRERIAAYYPSSSCFSKAAAQVFLTAVFERQLWRYPYARAYRAALAEAGHVCQTFCLTATWLGLAPFCLMGLADSVIEADLGIDGVSESVLYAAGVGRPPRGTTWAPLVTGTLKTRPNRSL
jgi:SagB-type dehydrogenase family enzyme